MIYLFHGEDFVSSRSAFNKEKDKESISLDSSDFDKNLLTQLLSETSLFSTHKKLFVENLFNKKSTKNAEDLFDLFKKAHHLDVYIWADKELTKTQTTNLSKYSDQNFKIPQNIFGFVDNISPGSPNNVKKFHEVLTYSSPEFVFSMLIRQFRLLLALIDRSGKNIDEINRLRDWQLQKLQRQYSLFGEKSINSIYKKLNKIDKLQKTGASQLNLVQSIDMFLLEI